MTVAYDASSESHTGSTVSASEASFSWTHTPVGTPRGVLVFVMHTGSAHLDDAVTYGGAAMQPVGGAFARDTVGGQLGVSAWFLGWGIPAGAQTVVVTRQNTANGMYAVALTATADDDTCIYEAGISLTGENGTLSEVSVNDGSPGVASMRFAGLASGLAAVPAAGANSTTLQSVSPGVTFAVARETTAGEGSRPVGFSSGTSTDRAVLALALREIALGVSTGVALDAVSAAHAPNAHSVSEASFSWTHTPTGTPRGVLVATYVETSTQLVSGVTYGGVAMTNLGSATDTSGGQRRTTLWFLGTGIPAGAQTVTVTRTNNGTGITAHCATVSSTGGSDTSATGFATLNENGTLAEQGVDDGSPGVDSLRFAAVSSGDSWWWGAAGANTVNRLAHRTWGSFRFGFETSPGQGSRSVGSVNGTTSDRAAAFVAISQTAAAAGTGWGLLLV